MAHRISAKDAGGWMAWYSGTENKEILSLPGDVTGVANFNLLRSMHVSPELAYGMFEDFAPSKIVSTSSYPGFTVTAITTGTLVMADRVGGWLQLTPNNSTGHGVQMQSDGEIFLPAADKDIWFECSVRGNDITKVNWFIGLATTDTDIIGSNPADLIGFHTHDGDANIDFEVSATAGAGSEVDTLSDLSNNTAVRLGFYVNGVTSVTPYIDGTANTTATSTTVANIPAVEMALSFACTTGEGQVNTLDIDWYKIVQLR